MVVGDHKHHSEGAAMAVEMVTARHSAQHRAGVDQPRDARLLQAVLVARDGVPNDEMPAVGPHVEEDAAVAAVEGPRAAAVGVRGEGRRRGGGEAGLGVSLHDLEPVEEAEQGRGSVEGAVAAEEPGVAEDAEPRLADEGGAEEVLGLVRREAEENLDHDVVDQRQRRAWRRHGALGAAAAARGGGEVFGGATANEGWACRMLEITAIEIFVKALFSSPKIQKIFRHIESYGTCMKH